MFTYDRAITISAAGSRKASHWPGQTLLWSDLVDKLRVPVRGKESMNVYLAMPKRQQDDLKDVGGYVAGPLKNGRRKAGSVSGRDVVTLDLDAIPAGQTTATLQRIDSLGVAYAVYSTRKHEETHPRLRVLFVLSRTAAPDEYEPVARKLAHAVGIELCDPSTFEASRLMYWPSCCADSLYVFRYADRPFADTDGLLALYGDWRNVSEWPEVPGARQIQQRLAVKQGDPTTKGGIVGAFCQCYDVYSALDSFLPGLYTPCDGSRDRYTYTGGSTTGGAVVYEDGHFLFSHHATDPCGGKLVNAFDLVRLHRFPEMDDDAKPDVPINKLPSYVAMCELAAADAKVSTLLNQRRYETATKDFMEHPEDNADWISKLKLNTAGAPAKTIDNILTILEHDPLLKNKLAYDEFSNRGLSLGELPWDLRVERRQWTDTDDSGLRYYIEKVYGITGERKLYDACALCAHKNSFNDVKEYLTGLTWDGVPRLDTLFVDYLGANDTPYTRAVSRKSLSAAVARIMSPGCKYDYIPILSGPQGIGKSTLLRKLGGQWFSDSLNTFEGKEASEMIQGTWINELGELNGLNRSESNAVKQFATRQDDIFRMPYGHRTERYPRRCVFFGTTNDKEFLKDSTGGRRFWPVDVGLRPVRADALSFLDSDVDQIWAEAFVRWQAGEPLYLSGAEEAEALNEQETHRETSAKEGLICDFLSRRIPEDWHTRTLPERRMYWGGEFMRESGKTVERDRVCAIEIWCECFGSETKFMRQSDTREINAILSRIKGWVPQRSPVRMGCYGPQRGFFRM